MATAHPHGHQHGAVHLDEAHWAAFAEHAEEEGELLLAFVTDAARWIEELRGPGAPPVRRVLDVGSGPGVGTCELARLFPDADVVAVDGSGVMLERAAARAAAQGLEGRVATHLAELPRGLDDLAAVDLVWASMSLHHVGDETEALAALRDVLAPGGLVAVAEVAEPMRVLPDDLDVGRPGLADRLSRAGAAWFEAMRAGLPDSVPSSDLPSMLAAAGLDVVGARVAHQRLDPPLPERARHFAVRHVAQLRHQLDGLLDADDLRALDALGDADDPRSAPRRPDLFLEASRQIVVARRPPGA
jgi:SAM-dependent methyltransferase